HARANMPAMPTARVTPFLFTATSPTMPGRYMAWAGPPAAPGSEEISPAVLAAEAIADVQARFGWCAGFDRTDAARLVAPAGLGVLLCGTRIARYLASIV